MAIAVAERIENSETQTFTLRLCPNRLDDGTCDCPKGDDKQPSPGHPSYHFAVTPTDPKMSPDEWAADAEKLALELETAARGSTD